jgi:hypothetical protein
VRFVPTKLHLFKEKGVKKFGFVQYTAAVVPNQSSGAEAEPSTSAAVPQLADHDLPSLDTLETAFLAFLHSAAQPAVDATPAVLSATLCPPEVLSALDSSQLVSGAKDRLKMLCLVGSRLVSAEGRVQIAAATLRHSAFPAPELALIRAEHVATFPVAATVEGLAEFFTRCTEGSQLTLV